MPRPLKAAPDRRDEVLALRLTAIERAELERSAAALGLTVAEFVRRRSLGYRLPALAADSRTRASLAAALMGLGHNLNQLTKAANAGRYQAATIEELLSRITAELDGYYGSGDSERRPIV